MTRRFPKITVWRAIFAAVMLSGLVRYIPAYLLRAGRVDEPER